MMRRQQKKKFQIEIQSLTTEAKNDKLRQKSERKNLEEKIEEIDNSLSMPPRLSACLRLAHRLSARKSPQ